MHRFLTTPDPAKRDSNRVDLNPDVVSDGVSALERWRQGNYAIVLADLHMPAMIGYLLARKPDRKKPRGALGCRSLELSEPDREIYACLCERLHPLPSNLLMIGDTENEGHPAPVHFGMQAIRLQRGRSDSELPSIKTAACI